MIYKIAAFVIFVVIAVMIVLISLSSITSIDESTETGEPIIVKPDEPGTTDEPGLTEVPDETSAPDTTDKSDTTDKPDTTDKSDTAKTPDTTKAPETTAPPPVQNPNTPSVEVPDANVSDAWAKELAKEGNAAVLISPYWISPRGLRGKEFYFTIRMEEQNLYLIRRYYFFSLRKSVLREENTVIVY